MKLTISILTALPLLAGVFVLQTPSSSVKSHADKLLNSKALTIKYTVQEVGGAAIEKTAFFSKPNKLRIESPAMLTVSDGTSLRVLDKKSNTYSEGPAPKETERLMQPDCWLWTAFFNHKFSDLVESSRAGKVRKMKGVSVREVELSLTKNPGTTATLLIDDSLGIARGMIWRETTPKAFELIVFADEIAMDKEPDEKLFAFNPPAGSTKVDASSPTTTDAPTWQQISAIFMGNCTGCHGSRMARGGLSLSTYESAMAGGRSGKIIVPGDPSASRIMQYLYGRGRPQMPPSGKMPDSVLQKIEKWIAAGATKS